MHPSTYGMLQLESSCTHTSWARAKVSGVFCGVGLKWLVSCPFPCRLPAPASSHSLGCFYSLIDQIPEDAESTMYCWEVVLPSICDTEACPRETSTNGDRAVHVGNAQHVLHWRAHMPGGLRIPLRDGSVWMDSFRLVASWGPSLIYLDFSRERTCTCPPSALQSPCASSECFHFVDQEELRIHRWFAGMGSSPGRHITSSCPFAAERTVSLFRGQPLPLNATPRVPQTKLKRAVLVLATDPGPRKMSNPGFCQMRTRERSEA